ncbi:DNA starvation/stationary phase protection protein [Arthrobacter crystallopoietes]|jgi:starvation-inducible DNA-binding protein|uniref:Dps family protein n=1 Tax=Micrococcaceae TaxID=1268 RepID=UPI0021C6581C|nr:DNA starvation/stationary phase protection protein [Arthrobacter sp. Marseille-P9274]
MAGKNGSKAGFTVPGLKLEDGYKVGETLQMRLHALNDLQLTLKHAHWNVVGRDFIGVHEMLDPQIEQVRAMIDAVAERMATMGVSPNGLPGALVSERTWDDYSIGRAGTAEHLAALNLVYNGVVEDHRKAIEEVGDIDPITEDLLIGQTAELELFQWFIRAHLENAEGRLESEGARTEKDAAGKTEKGSKSDKSGKSK